MNQKWNEPAKNNSALFYIQISNKFGHQKKSVSLDNQQQWAKIEKKDRIHMRIGIDT